MASRTFPKLARVRYALWGLTVVAALVFAGLYMRGALAPQEGRQATQTGEAAIRSEFTLTDHTGARVTEADFLGRWQLVFFGFTYCPDVCPTTLAYMASVLDTLEATADRIAPLFITVDPARDTPDVMAEETVRVIDPWTRATILMSRPGAVYLTVESARDDRLLSVESPVADRVMIHKTENNDGVNRMVHLDAMNLPAGERVVLAPGGTHLMLMGLSERLTEGARFPVTLRFEQTSEVTVTVPVPVLGVGAKGPKEDMQ